MKVKELLNDWIEVPDQHFKIPKVSGKYIDKASAGIGIFQVWRDENNIQIEYWGVQDEIPIVYMLLAKLPPYLMAKNAVSTIQKKGLGSELLNYILRKESTSIFSDFQMSESGVKLWNTVSKYNNVKIVNLMTHKSFDFDDVGDEHDSEIVLHPKDDTHTIPAKLDNIQHNEQKFVFMIVAPEPIIIPRKSIKESKIGKKTPVKIQPFIIPDGAGGMYKESNFMPNAYFLEGV